MIQQILIAHFSNRFHSPKREGVFNQEVTLDDLEDSVIFWRTAPFNPDSSIENQKWRSSSFRLIRNVSGWSQSNYDQLSKNNFSLENDPQRKFEFVPNQRSFYARTIGNPPRQDIYNQHITTLDGEMLDFSICAAVPSLYVTVLDSVSLDPWFTRFTDSQGNTANPNNFWNNFNDQGNCGARSLRAHQGLFRMTDPNEMAGFFDMIQNGIRIGSVT